MTKQPPLIDDCFLHDKDRLRHEDALKLFKERLKGVVGSEAVTAQEGLDRILAEDIFAPHKVPLHTNAAVDGYAFKHADLTEMPLPVSGRIAAGDLAPPPLLPNTAIRIFTGAPMPSGADTVAMQEDCQAEDHAVLLPSALKQGANCRQAGEDLAKGDLILKHGTRLRAADLAALASIGKAEFTAYRQLKVALFSSGNEMRTPGSSDEQDEQLKVGEVYDANQPLLAALCAPMPIKLTSFDILKDEREAVKTALKSASSSHDIIITTGGASRGAEDHMLSVLDELGKRHLWQLAVKPGRPMMFGQIRRDDANNDCLFFGLPGNPVAAMVCFLLYTRPALLALAGASWTEPTRFAVPAQFEITNKKPDRREFLRGILSNGPDGTVTVDKFARDGSGLISSLREADGLIEIPEEVTKIQKGDLVSFIPFSGFN